MKKRFAIYIFSLLLFSASIAPAADSTLQQAGPVVSSKTETGIDSIEALPPEPVKIDDKEVIRAFSDSLTQQSGYPVTVNNNEVFRLYGKIGTIEPEERARKTSKLLADFFRSSTPIDSLTIVEGETLTAIRTPRSIIAAFSEEDAAAENMTRLEFADSALARISNQATQFREETSGRNILFSVLKSLALLVALAIFWHYLNNFFILMDGWIQKIRLHHSSNSENKLIQLLSPDHLASGLGWFSKIVELFLKILLIYAYLATMLSFFPWTEDLSTNLLAFVLEPAKKLSSEFVTLIPNVIAIIILITIARYLGKFSDIFFRNISKGELKLGDFDAEWAEPTRKIVKITLYLLLAFALFASLPLANNRTALALAIIFGLTVSLSAVPTVQNMFTGIMLNYTGSFRIGDRVKIGDVTGDIVYKGPLVIRIKSLLNEIILMPNTTAFRSKIINYTESVQKNGHLSLEIVLYLKDNIKIDTLRELVTEAALGTDGIMLDPKPLFLRAETKNGLFGYTLRVNTKEEKNLEALYSRLFQNVQNKLQENNYNLY
ncbi:MAG: mechanosensitive ion channel family protein [Chlorobiales bacterium]|nr:mechanosensitive ion channel family protein [Chlorobiales bacterium]